MIIELIRNKKTQLILKIVFVTLIALWFVLWSTHISNNLYGSSSGPDERLRMLVPTYIYHHHSLPSGYNPEVIYDTGNWSYAFYPQVLGAIVSAVFMSIVGIFNNTNDALLVGARLASVLFGSITVVIVGMTIRKLLEGRRHAISFSYLAMTLIAFWPQFAFLSGYVNNDIVALCGVSLIIYASAVGYKSDWNSRSAALLGLGFTICLLGYTNSWGFILCGGLFFLFTFKKNFKALFAAAIIPLAIAGPFFIRNAIIYNGDFLGLKTFQDRTLAWEAIHHMNVQGSYLASGRSIFHFLHDQNYWSLVEQSFIGKFGYMTISPNALLLLVYKGLIILGIAGVVIKIIVTIKKSNRKPGRSAVLFWLSLLGGSAITIILSAYYTLTVDVQSQGRYIIYLLVPLVILSTLGIKYLNDTIVSRKYWFIVPLILVLLYVANSAIIYDLYIA